MGARQMRLNPLKHFKPANWKMLEFSFEIKLKRAEMGGFSYLISLNQ